MRKPIIIILLLMLFACERRPTADGDVELADATPASSQVRPLLTEGIESYENRDFLTAIQCFLEAEKKAGATSDSILLGEIYYDLGSAFFQISSHGQSLDYFYRALKVCPTEESGDALRFNINYGISGVYFKDGDYDKAQELLEPYYRRFIAEDDTSSLVYTSGFMSMIARRKGDIDGACGILDNAKRYLTPSSPHDEGWILTLESSARYSLGDYDRVEQIWNRLEHINDMNPADKGLVAVYMGRIRSSQGRCAEALQLMDSASASINLNDRPFYFSTLADIYGKCGDYRRALAYKDSVVIYKDSVEILANRKLLDATRTQLEVFKFSNEMEENINRLRRRNLTIGFVGIAAVLLAAVIVLLMRNRLLRTQNKIRMAEMQLELESQQRAAAEERLKVTEMETRMEQERLNASIEEQQLKLSASSTFIAARNKLVQSLISEIDKVEQVKEEPEIDKLCKRLRTMARTSQAEYENLMATFEQANPVFFRRMSELHPSLTQSDLGFLALVRMNMTSKDIAVILNINPESCKRRKIRLARKMGLDGSGDLFGYVLSI